MYVVIAGCGRLGSLLAGELSRSGHSVVIIDRSQKAFAALPPEFSGFKVCGDATEFSILRAAEIEKADCVFATCREDNLNLMITQAARHVFDVSSVTARIQNPSLEEIFSVRFNVGIISATRLALDACLKALNGPETEP